MPAIDPNADPVPERGGAYTYQGAVHWEYSPELDHDPDPGEIVWSWVAFEEDDSIGKDRPIAVVGRSDDRRLVALMLSSKDHDGDRGWIPIGAGPWDREGRDSWVRSDRILVVESRSVRREGAIIPRETYDVIVSGMQQGRPTPNSLPHAQHTPPHPWTPAPASPPAPSSGGFFAAIGRLFGRK